MNKKKTTSPKSNLLSQKVSKFPLSSGVYLMKDKHRKVIYIGKAKSLRQRVRSYFFNTQKLPKISLLMERVTNIDFLETPTEIDALLLESHLIRKYKPKYNTELKDDKSFPLIKITADKFPRVHIARNLGKDRKRGIYYGPYTDSKLLRQAVTLINSLFPIRKCQALPKTSCLYYHIGQCVAPCIKKDVKSKYDKLIKEIRTFLGGGKKSFIEYLTESMKTASDELRFEDALFFKEQIDALGKLRKKRFKTKYPEQGILLSGTASLKQILKLQKLPSKIVCFDVSNIQGDSAVASKVSFYRELPEKFAYKRYRIKTVGGINDYKMIAEGLSRMLRGIKEGREDFVPDLILIDGGIGHLNTALKVLKNEEMENLAVISIAKRFEHIYSPKSKDPIIIRSDSSALYLLQKIRDEAHRFAVFFHRVLKAKSLRHSILDKVPGIGPKRKSLLLQEFGSIDAIKVAGIKKISEIAKIDDSLAKNVKAMASNYNNL